MGLLAKTLGARTNQPWIQSIPTQGLSQYLNVTAGQTDDDLPWKYQVPNPNTAAPLYGISVKILDYEIQAKH